MIFNNFDEIEEELEKHDSDYEEVMDALRFFFENMDCDTCASKKICTIKNTGCGKFYCSDYYGEEC